MISLQIGLPLDFPMMIAYKMLIFASPGSIGVDKGSCWCAKLAQYINDKSLGCQCVNQDTSSDENGLLSIDKGQDCDNFAYEFFSEGLAITFTRKFDTCDDGEDYIIEVMMSKLLKVKYSNLVCCWLGRNYSSRLEHWSRPY